MATSIPPRLKELTEPTRAKAKQVYDELVAGGMSQAEAEEKALEQTKEWADSRTPHRAPTEADPGD